MWTDAKPSPRFEATDRYLPLDELLELPRVRVLRVLQRRDWSSMREILDHLNENDPATWQAFNSALIRHVKSGSVDRRGTIGSYEYRITQAGREELRRILAKADVNEGKR